MSNKNVAQYVMLAEVSYADLTDATGSPLAKGSEAYKNALKKSNFAKADDDGQITLLKDNWSVVANWKDRTDETSFSATLFQGTEKSGESGQYVLAFKGSKEPKDFFVADLGDIVLDGFALKQSIDLINFRQRLIANKDETYDVLKPNKDDDLSAEFKQYDYNWDEISDELKAALKSDQYLIDGTDIYLMEWENSAEVFTTPGDPRAEGVGVKDLNNIIVTGHSLGGNLAAIYSTWFNQDVSEAWMVNGASFRQSVIAQENNNFNDIANFLKDKNINTTVNTAIPSDKIANITGDKGANIVAQDWDWLLNQPGQQPELFIEKAIDGLALSHGSAQMTDSTAVMDLFMRIDKSLQSNSVADILKQFNPVFEAMSNRPVEQDDEMTLENIVNAMYKLYYPDETETVLKGDRGKLYNHILALQEKITDESKAKLILDIDEIGRLASAKENNIDNIAARYSLKELLPFAITGADIGYTQLNSEHDFDLFNAENPDSVNGMTTQYIFARTQMLKDFFAFNNSDIESTSEVNNYYEEFDGNGNYIRQLTSHPGKPITLSPRYIFGDIDAEKDDTMTISKVMPEMITFMAAQVMTTWPAARVTIPIFSRVSGGRIRSLTAIKTG